MTKTQEFTIEKLEELVSTLHRVEWRAVGGNPACRGYDNNMYNDMLSEWQKAYKVTRAEGGRARTEVLWMNYEVDARQLSLNI